MPQLETRCFSELARDAEWNAIVPRAAVRFSADSDFAALHEDLVANDAANLRVTVPALLVQGGDDNQISAASTMAAKMAMCPLLMPAKAIFSADAAPT